MAEAEAMTRKDGGAAGIEDGASLSDDAADQESEYLLRKNADAPQEETPRGIGQYCTYTLAVR